MAFCRPTWKTKLLISPGSEARMQNTSMMFCSSDGKFSPRYDGCTIALSWQCVATTVICNHSVALFSVLYVQPKLESREGEIHGQGLEDEQVCEFLAVSKHFF